LKKKGRDGKVLLQRGRAEEAKTMGKKACDEINLSTSIRGQSGMMVFNHTEHKTQLGGGGSW